MGTEATRVSNNLRIAFPKDAVVVRELSADSCEVTILATNETFAVNEKYSRLTEDMDIDVLKREIQRLRREVSELSNPADIGRK